MIAANIGKIFLDAYNEKYKCNYSAKTFFVEKYFAPFFDHEKYMQWVINSPFVQGLKKGVSPKASERKLKLDALIKKISMNEADASIAIGFPSLDLLATTSGQITNMNLPYKDNEMYLSWIGSGFGIGVQGGMCILFDNPQILLDLYEGWQLYREFLNKTHDLRGNQINNWNGQWIAHRYNKMHFDESCPTASFFPIGAGKEGGLEVITQSWTKVIVGIARNYPDTLMTAYIYNLVKTNITIGFIPFELPRIRQPFELFAKYFSSIKPEEVEHLFGTAIGFLTACEMGVIGVSAMEPKGFKDYIQKGTIPKYDGNDKEKTNNFYTYLIWILAMLNNEKLWDISREFAQQLINYKAGAEKSRMNRKTNVENLLSSTTSKQFLLNLIPLIEDEKEVVNYEEMGKLVHLMPNDNFPYFNTLVRFQYAILNK